MIEVGGAAGSRSTDTEAGTSGPGVPELEVEEKPVLGIDLRVDESRVK